MSPAVMQSVKHIHTVISENKIPFGELQVRSRTRVYDQQRGCEDVTPLRTSSSVPVHFRSPEHKKTYRHEPLEHPGLLSSIKP
jgi:hypothetical protein